MNQNDELSLIRAWGTQEPEYIDHHLAALAAVLTALEPDVRLLTSRVRSALDGVLEADLLLSDEFEHAWISTGAASLYNAVMELSELFYDSFEDFHADPRGAVEVGLPQWWLRASGAAS
jgi:hypothetical protein